MHADPVQALDDLLLRTRAALSGATRTGGEPTTGASDDGLVSATVGPDGLVRSISMHPTILRRSPDDIADSVVDAVNQAVTAQPEAPATSGLIEELKAIQEELAVNVRRMGDEFTSAVKRLQERPT